MIDGDRNEIRLKLFGMRLEVDPPFVVEFRHQLAAIEQTRTRLSIQQDTLLSFGAVSTDHSHDAVAVDRPKVAVHLTGLVEPY
jgi:hypothetical protein